MISCIVGLLEMWPHYVTYFGQHPQEWDPRNVNIMVQ